MLLRLTHALLLLGFAACGPATPPDPPEVIPVAPSEAALLAQRPYRAVLPAGWDAGQQWPLLLVLHGYGGSGELTSERLGLTPFASDAGFVRVAPPGLIDSLGNPAWHPGPRHSPSWDVEYLTAVIHDVEKKAAVDPRRVFVIGHSQGAHMAHRLGCDAANELAALVSVAGQVTKVGTDCQPARAVPVLQVHGDEDAEIGYYGDVQHTPPDPAIPSAHETVALWAHKDQCSGPIASTGAAYDLDSIIPGNETTVEAWGGCPAGIAVELWTMTGVGHAPFITEDFAPRVTGFLTAHPRPQ